MYIPVYNAVYNGMMELVAGLLTWKSEELTPGIGCKGTWSFASETEGLGCRVFLCHEKGGLDFFLLGALSAEFFYKSILSPGCPSGSAGELTQNRLVSCHLPSPPTTQ